MTRAGGGAQRSRPTGAPRRDRITPCSRATASAPDPRDSTTPRRRHGAGDPGALGPGDGGRGGRRLRSRPAVPEPGGAARADPRRQRLLRRLLRHRRAGAAVGRHHRGRADDRRSSRRSDRAAAEPGALRRARRASRLPRRAGPDRAGPVPPPDARGRGAAPRGRDADDRGEPSARRALVPRLRAGAAREVRPRGRRGDRRALLRGRDRLAHGLARRGQRHPAAGAEALRWRRESLDRALRRSPRLATALEALVAQDLAHKVRHGQPRATGLALAEAAG